MKKVILSMMVSADGMTAGPNGDLDWFASDADFETEMLALLRRVDAMLFGRKSYLELAEFWPHAAAEGSPEAPGGFTSRERQLEFTRLMNTIPKIVFSTTLRSPEWGPVELVERDVAGAVARLKSAPGGDLVLFAGAGLARTFAQLDLIDEYRLMVHPVMLGDGLPLFGGPPGPAPAKQSLALLGSQTFSSGVVLLRYARRRDDRASADARHDTR